MNILHVQGHENSSAATLTLQGYSLERRAKSMSWAPIRDENRFWPFATPPLKTLEQTADPDLRQCALEARIGKNGVTDQKREGDSKTPLGSFALRQLYYRPDRLFKPQTPLPTIALRPDDLWCDDPDHPLYNRPVSAPFTASHEKMWREDRCYDLCIVLDYNLVQPHPQKGSAIFFHLTTDDHRPGPTEGCVAISLNDMLMILPTLHLGTVMTISTAD